MHNYKLGYSRQMNDGAHGSLYFRWPASSLLTKSGDFLLENSI
jgi:hypothetical protein